MILPNISINSNHHNNTLAITRKALKSRDFYNFLVLHIPTITCEEKEPYNATSIYKYVTSEF